MPQGQPLGQRGPPREHRLGSVVRKCPGEPPTAVASLREEAINSSLFLAGQDWFGKEVRSLMTRWFCRERRHRESVIWGPWSCSLEVRAEAQLQAKVSHGHCSPDSSRPSRGRRLR